MARRYAIDTGKNFGLTPHPDPALASGSFLRRQPLPSMQGQMATARWCRDDPQIAKNTGLLQKA